MDVVRQLDGEMASVVEKVRSSLVQIRNGHRGSGAGTIWHAKGLIVTNAHVIGRGGFNVTLPDGRTLPGRLLAKDPERDLAALMVEASDLPTIELGDSQGLRPGQWVFAVGHPWGVAGAATGGIVIGVGPAQNGAKTAGEWVVVSLHMRPGHSGGPLVDEHGRLVGINTMINGPDVGMAVPVQEVKKFLRNTLRA